MSADGLQDDVAGTKFGSDMEIPWKLIYTTEEESQIIKNCLIWTLRQLGWMRVRLHLSGSRTQRALKRTWQSVAALVLEGMVSPLHYSPTPSHSVFSTAPCHSPHMSNTPTHKHLDNTCIRTISPRPLPAKALLLWGKVFDSFPLGVTACRISLGSCAETFSFFFFFFLFFSPQSSLTTPLWSALTCVSCEKCLVPLHY